MTTTKTSDHIDVKIYDTHMSPPNGDHFHIIEQAGPPELWVYSYADYNGGGDFNSGGYTHQRIGLKEADDLITVLTYWRNKYANKTQQQIDWEQSLLKDEEV